MIDEPRRRPGAESVETMDSFPAQPRRPVREEQETLDTYPEQPPEEETHAKVDALMGDAGARDANTAAGE